jgi:hypothetical protein
VGPSSSDKGKGPACSSSTPDAAGRLEGVRRHRLRRADGSFVSDLPLDSDSPQKRQKTAGEPSAATSFRFDTTTATAYVRPATVTAGAAAATTTGAPLPRPLEVSRSQVSLGSSKCQISSVAFTSTGLDPSFPCQGPFFSFCGRSSPFGCRARRWAWFPAAYICWGRCRRSVSGYRSFISVSAKPSIGSG